MAFKYLRHRGLASLDGWKKCMFGIPTWDILLPRRLLLYRQ